jgi:hypothetical protein
MQHTHGRYEHGASQAGILNQESVSATTLLAT